MSRIVDLDNTDWITAESTTGQMFIAVYVWPAEQADSPYRADADAVEFYAVPEHGRLRDATLVASYKLAALADVTGDLTLRLGDPTMVLNADTVAAIVGGAL